MCLLGQVSQPSVRIFVALIVINSYKILCTDVPTIPNPLQCWFMCSHLWCGNSIFQTTSKLTRPDSVTCSSTSLLYLSHVTSQVTYFVLWACNKVICYLHIRYIIYFLSWCFEFVWGWILLQQSEACQAWSWAGWVDPCLESALSPSPCVGTIMSHDTQYM